jgi:hypothetical protein
MTALDPPRQAHSVPAWTIALPTAPAAVLAAAASLAEIRTPLLALVECDPGVGTVASGLFLVVFALPGLWLVQTVLIAVPAFLLALVYRRRSVVAIAIGLLACVVLPTVAWAFLAWSGLPIEGGTCPRWL